MGGSFARVHGSISDSPSHNAPGCFARQRQERGGAIVSDQRAARAGDTHVVTLVVSGSTRDFPIRFIEHRKSKDRVTDAGRGTPEAPSRHLPVHRIVPSSA